ncbi:LysR family transcriptional regulator [Tateyamaria sp.]|uniref:LysR family transcriptional regulator n=1 Tax=Tateyamaria sp. TaxID=1929288 RepID=UPI0039B97299
MQYWDDLRYLLALDQHRSLNNAARFLKTDPTTVSRRIKRLSDYYQKTLIFRQPNGEWALTEDGEKFAVIAQRCSVAIETIEDQIQATTSNITISTTDFVADYILAPHVRNILSEQNDLVVDIDSNHQNVRLAYGEADLAIRLRRPSSGSLITSKLADIEVNLFSMSGRMTKQWVGLSSKFDHQPEMQMGFEFFGCQPVLRSSNFATIRKLAVEHDLACIGPKFMMNEWQGLKLLNHFTPSIHREVWSVFHEKNKNDEALRRVRCWVRDCFKEQFELSNGSPCPR